MRKSYESIQWLRAFAALIVVAHHARNPKPWLFDGAEGVHLGEAGVDIFFVISGFIMYAAARQENPREFLRRRLIRIAPLYWIATFLIFVISSDGLRAGLGDNVRRLILSLLFIPHANPQYGGQFWPVLIPGWTLNYEMFFYLLFAVGLATGRILSFMTLSLAILVGIGLVVDTGNALFETYTNPLLLEFLGGIFLAKFYDVIATRNFGILLPLGLAALVLGTLSEGSRVIVFGIPAIAIVAGALSLESRYGNPTVPALRKIGDASYSIYLFQGFAVGIAGFLTRRLPLAGWPQLTVMLALSLAAAIVIGLLTYAVLERPLIRRLAKLKPAGKLEVQAAP